MRRYAAWMFVVAVGCADGGGSDGGESDGSTGGAASSSGADESGESSESSGGPEPAVYPLVETPFTALQTLYEPLAPPPATLDAIDSGALAVTDHDQFADFGLGVQPTAGQPWIEDLELATDFVPGEPSERRSLAYLWQSADPQLIDEESPIRFSAFVELYRPQGHLTTQVFEAHVRSAERLSQASGRPFDFGVVAGDLTDGSHQNELEWLITALTGGVIDPDSGIDDDPIAGPGNDYNDPFVSDGLDAPWYAALGNHETIYNGGFGALSDEIRAAAVGDTVFDFGLFQNGARDGSTPLADLVPEGATTPPDERRLPLRVGEVLQTLHDAPGDPAGHGLTQSDVDAERGYFAVAPIPGKPIRLIVLDTVRSDADELLEGLGGDLDSEQFMWLQDQLADADANAELVIVMSHHRPDDFAASSEIGASDLRTVLRESDGVVMHLVGHIHLNEHAPKQLVGEFGYWELMLSSTVDFPMHSRIIEIVDEGNGFLSIYATNLEHNSPHDSLAHHGRELAAARRSFPAIENLPDVITLWEEDLPHQNLLLRLAIPDALASNLAMFRWPTRIESEETLAPLPVPDL